MSAPFPSCKSMWRQLNTQVVSTHTLKAFKCCALSKVSPMFSRWLNQGYDNIKHCRWVIDETLFLDNHNDFEFYVPPIQQHNVVKFWQNIRDHSIDRQTIFLQYFDAIDFFITTEFNWNIESLLKKLTDVIKNKKEEKLLIKLFLNVWINAKN